MKKLILLIVLLSFQAEAGIYGYDMYLPGLIQGYMSSVDQESPREGMRSCEGGYSAIHQKGVYDIRYALGYFDDTTGTDRIVNGINYGKSPSLDIAIFDVLRNAWTSGCYGNLRLCGFKESGNPQSGKVELRKYEKIQGKSVLVRITLTYASASESFEKNKTVLADTQKRLTAQSEENYFDGLKVADVIFYNGHSRDGGGPDFALPVLTSQMKTNYSGYYRPKQPGFKKLLSSLKQNPNKEAVVGMFSCYSRKHFYNDFIRQNSRQKLILSSDTIDYFDSLLSSVGYLEALLRGSCGPEVAKIAKKNPKIRGGFVDVNM